jgi:RNA polymerase sigma-70 factor (ECF subfamily)
MAALDATDHLMTRNEITLVDDQDGTDLAGLFRAHYGRLVRALTLVCGDVDEAADAVQEAFVKAHLRWRKLRHYDDPVGWIRHVAINRLRDGHRRRIRKDRAVERLAATSDHSVAGPEPGHDGLLTTLLASLPRQQRLVVALYYVDGLSVAETAATLGVSDGAVKFHLHQARERLRGALDAGMLRGGER